MPPKAGWLLYDGDCSLCERAARSLSRFDLDGRLSLLDLRRADFSVLPVPLTRERCGAKLHLVEADGRVSVSFEAVKRLSALLPALWPAAPLLHFPGARLLLEPAWLAVEHLRYRLGSPR